MVQSVVPTLCIDRPSLCGGGFGDLSFGYPRPTKTRFRFRLDMTQIYRVYLWVQTTKYNEPFRSVPREWILGVSQSA